MLGENLKRLRNERGINQGIIAKMLNITRQAYSNWERNENLPDINSLSLIADFFNVSTDFLLGRETEKTPVPALSDSEMDLLAVFRRANKNFKVEQRAIGVLENYLDKYVLVNNNTKIGRLE